MKKTLFILLLFSLQLSAQKEANFWYFGENAGLDFSTEIPTAINNGELSTDEGCSSISNEDGELLFYSDGLSVWNKENNFMRFSDGTLASNNLFGNPSSTQSGLIVPKPNSTSIYYLFTVDDGPIFNFDGTIFENGRGLNFYTIDMDKNGGLGEIINGPTNLSFDNENEWSEKVTAVAGEECNTFWLISATSSSYYSFKIDENGIDNLNPVVSNITFRDNRRGYLSVSPDGTKLVEANQGDNSRSKIYDFNNSTGAITNERTLNVPANAYGVAFSPSSNKLYISTGQFSQLSRNGRRNNPANASIYQFNLTSNNIGDINRTRSLIYETNSGYRGALQLAPNGKIYYARSRTNYLGVINFPENDATGADFEENGIFLEQGLSTEGLPPFIQSFFASVNIVDTNNTEIVLNNDVKELCENEILNIRPELDFSSFTVESLSWTKENDNTVLSDNENLTIDKNLGSGVYIFEATATDECGKLKKYSNTIEIVFNNKPLVNTIPVFIECDFDENRLDFITNFKLSSRENQIYSGTDNVTINFFETTDTTFSNPLNKEEYRNSTPTETSNHQLVAKITNDKGCFETVTIELKVNSSDLTFYKDVFLCELDNNSSSLKSNGTGNSTFDFNEKTAQIISASNGALNITDYNFDYFLTRKDANLKQNKIVSPFESLYENETDIFIRISLKATNNCESIGQFKIFVRELPAPLGEISPILLCINNPILNPQPNTVTLNASTGFSEDSYVWYFNDQEITGETSSILNANKAGNYRVEAYRIYENDVTNVNDDIICSGYNTFTVFTSNEPIITEVSVLDNQDSFQDNSITIKVDGIGEYEYAINSTLDSDFNKGTENLSFTFTNVSAGLNVIYIKDRNGCGTLTESKTIPFLYFQRHFTPNGDGKFDVWKVQGIDDDFFTSISYQIYDRFGKLLKNINQKIEDGWNGNFNGNPLPEDDYWYNITLIDINGNITKKTGHFSLIRE